MPARVRKSKENLKNENLIMKGKLAGKVAVLALYHPPPNALWAWRVSRCKRVANALQPRRFGFRGQAELAGGLKTHRFGFRGQPELAVRA